MPDASSTRRLAAILAADVVGYSRMMGANEAGTLAALKRHREAVFDPAVAANHGRIVKLIGDGTLVEFGSVVDAVNCAMAIQRTAASDTSDPRIVLRIGVNLGDIMIDGDDIYGDGVNVAARLEPLAEPGGICVSSIVNESVGTRIEVAFADGGEVQVKNIERPLRIWKWRPSREGSAPIPAKVAAAPATADKPSIAVLPFTNMSGDPEQEYFSDGISEDIITDLSKVAGLLVIARNSSFTYKGKAVDIRAVGRELGVTSVLEGSIRRAANRVRITAQLIEAASGTHLWADRYDRDLTDIFALQDEVTSTIVKALRVTLTPNEKALILDGGTTSAEAHDNVLRARALLVHPIKTRELFEKIVALLNRALELDPAYSDAYAGLSMAHNLNFHNRWSGDPDASQAIARDFADKAIAANPNEPFGHYVACVAYTFAKDLDRAADETEKALAVSPNYSMALNARGVTNIYKGDAAKAIPDIETAMRLDPQFGQQYLHFLGVAHLMLGNYETAAAHFRERILIVPETDLTRAFLAAALGQLGQIDEARRVWADLKRVNPKYSFANHIGRLPFRRPQDVERVTAGLARAGLPD